MRISLMAFSAACRTCSSFAGSFNLAPDDSRSGSTRAKNSYQYACSVQNEREQRDDTAERQTQHRVCRAYCTENKKTSVQLQQIISAPGRGGGRGAVVLTPAISDNRSTAALPATLHAYPPRIPKRPRNSGRRIRPVASSDQLISQPTVSDHPTLSRPANQQLTLTPRQRTIQYRV